MEKRIFINQNKSFEVISTIKGKDFIILVNKCFRNGKVNMCKNIPSEKEILPDKDAWERRFNEKCARYSGSGYIEKDCSPSKIL